MQTVFTINCNDERRVVYDKRPFFKENVIHFICTTKLTTETFGESHYKVIIKHRFEILVVPRLETRLYVFKGVDKARIKGNASLNKCNICATFADRKVRIMSMAPGK